MALPERTDRLSGPATGIHGEARTERSPLLPVRVEGRGA